MFNEYKHELTVEEERKAQLMATNAVREAMNANPTMTEWDRIRVRANALKRARRDIRLAWMTKEAQNGCNDKLGGKHYEEIENE